MRQFTKQEIDLCKKIAEKSLSRKRLDDGDYFFCKVFGKEGIFLVSDMLSVDWHKTIREDKKAIFLWQEHDCLEWLRGKGYIIAFVVDLGAICPKHRNIISITICGRERAKTYYGKTPLEALLRTVLAVMEGK